MIKFRLHFNQDCGREVKLQFQNETRKHSSRIRTTRFSDSETPWTETSLDSDPLKWNMGPGTETPPRRNMEPWSQTGSDIIQRPPCEQND